MNPQPPRRNTNPNYQNSPAFNQLWSDAMRLPSRSNTPYETHTYVPETQYVRANIPPTWDDVLTSNYNYGTIPSNPRYKLIESQPGQNAWSDDFFVPSAEHGFVYTPPTADQLVTNAASYDFDSPKYNGTAHDPQLPVKSRSARVIPVDDDIDIDDLQGLIPGTTNTDNSYNFDEPQYT